MIVGYKGSKRRIPAEKKESGDDKRKRKIQLDGFDKTMDLVDRAISVTK